jgi:hypothetical protein
MWNTFLPCHPPPPPTNSRKSIALFEGSSPACPCDARNIKTKLRIRQLCGDSDEKTTYYRFRSVHHKSHMDWPRIKPRPPRSEVGDWPNDPCHGLSRLVFLCIVYQPSVTTSQKTHFVSIIKVIGECRLGEWYTGIIQNTHIWVVHLPLDFKRLTVTAERLRRIIWFLSTVRRCGTELKMSAQSETTILYSASVFSPGCHVRFECQQAFFLLWFI